MTNRAIPACLAIAAILAGREPDRVIAAGGGKLLNIVIRDA